MSEITWIIDQVTGALLIEGLAVGEASTLVGDLLPDGREFGCGHPLTVLPPPLVLEEDCVGVPQLRVAGYYHHSLVEGPGRRSSLLVVGCTIGCRGFIYSLLPMMRLYQRVKRQETPLLKEGRMVTDTAAAQDDVARWVQRFLDDLTVVRSANTVRAYGADIQRWIAFCRTIDTHPFAARPRMAIEFIRAECKRPCGKDRTVSPRTIVRRLSAVRQWYAYLALEPEVTGVQRNPIPMGTAARAGAGAIAGKPALLRYDRPLPDVLTAADMDCFMACLTATRYRDRAIAWLLKDGGMRIGEVLGLRLGDINWGKRILTVRATKNRMERLVPISQDAIAVLADYVRLERPKPLDHDVVFVNLGHRGYGQPFTYRSWVAICHQARQAAGTPHIHAHAFRHTYATNMAESGMPLDTLKRVLGHRHLETVSVYNHVRDSRVHREYEQAMETRQAGGPA